MPNGLALSLLSPHTVFAQLFWKTLDNNDLNQVMASSGFSENKGLCGVLSLAGSKNLVSVILI